MSSPDVALPSAQEPVADIAQAAAAFVPFGDVLYLDCAARAPRLRAVLASGHAALEAAATPWREPSGALETRMETLRACAADTVFDGNGGLREISHGRALR